MKDNRFIELVNLYIDRQISAEETAELEAEILTNAKHRQIYQQYCRMHRATSMVFENFRSNAEAAQAGGSRPDASIACFENNRRRNRVRWSWATAGLAAAACLGVVLIQQQRQTDAQTETVAAARPAMVPTVALPVGPAVTETTLAPSTPALAEQQYAALLAAKRQEEIRAFALSQQKVAKPLSLFEDGESLTLDGKNLFPLGKRPTQAEETGEFTAFQFQR